MMLDAYSWVIMCNISCATSLCCTCSHFFGSHIHVFIFIILFGAESGDISARLLGQGGLGVELHLC